MSTRTRASERITALENQNARLTASIESYRVILQLLLQTASYQTVPLQKFVADYNPAKSDPKSNEFKTLLGTTVQLKEGYRLDTPLNTDISLPVNSPVNCHELINVIIDRVMRARVKSVSATASDRKERFDCMEAAFRLGIDCLDAELPAPDLSWIEAPLASVQSA